MNDPRGFVSGLVLPLRAAGVLVRRPGLWPWAIAPLVVNVLLYVGVVMLAFWLVGQWRVEVDWQFWGPVGGWLAAMTNNAAGVTKWIIAMPLVFVICYFSFVTVGMIVASPFNDALSERTERSLCGDHGGPTIGWVRSAAAVVASVIDAAAIVVRQVGWSIVALPFLLVPVIGVLPLLAVSAWFTGRAFFDVAAARNLLRRRHTKPILRRVRWRVLGLGVAMVMLFAVPFAGLLMLPVGVVAGTLAYCGIDWPRELADARVDPPVGFTPPGRVA